jgi:hypothetical protein
MRIVAVVIGVALLALVIMSYFAGLFDSVKVSMDTTGPYALVYRQHKGPYGGIKFAMYDVFAYCRDNRGFSPKRGFAIFYSDPQIVKPDSLLSDGGYITDTLLTNVPEPYKTSIFTQCKSVTATFPLRSFLSPMTGATMFYPAMVEFLKKENKQVRGPVMEMYDIAAKKIVYIAPLK